MEAVAVTGATVHQFFCDSALPLGGHLFYCPPDQSGREYGCSWVGYFRGCYLQCLIWFFSGISGRKGDGGLEAVSASTGRGLPPESNQQDSSG